MSTCELPGVVPILEAHLPEDPQTDRPWYSMPLGRPLWDAFASKDPRAISGAFVRIAETLASLHAQKIAHRDIKPANLLLIGNSPAIADFGLVDYPDKQELTAPREAIGPRVAMAPEIRELGPAADALPADVYSLAKTFWMFLTGRKQGFEGQYHDDTSIGLRQHIRNEYLAPLENLLKAATDHRPTSRPTMAEFQARLKEWLRIVDSWEERNPLEWIDVQRRLFPVIRPERAIWTDIDDIVQILSLLGERTGLNHLFFPSGGGMDLTGAIRSDVEPGCIELDTEGQTVVLRPARLLFESFGTDAQWDYFRLEAAPLDPSGVYDEAGLGLDEEVTEIPDVGYVERWHWDENEYEEKSLPEGSRVVSRYFGGAFVIFQKTSFYNRISATYDARHNKMSADEFREYMSKGAVSR